MKKIMNKINFGLIGLMLSVPAFAAKPAAAAAGTANWCQLITKLQDVFKLLRTLAFVGAAFYIAQWAWTYISKGEVKTEELKDKGIGLLVGFSLLFLIGVVLSFMLGAANGGSASGLFGCQKEVLGGWN